MFDSHNYYNINIRSSSLRRINFLSSTLSADPQYGSYPEPGDVVIGQILEVNQHTRFEEPGGEEIELIPGQIVSVVLGRRYSTKEFYGELPKGLSFKTEFDLLNVGGIGGMVVNKNSMAKAPTKLLYLGHAINDRKQKINTLNFGLTITKLKDLEQDRSLRIIIVFGSDMDCGKTFTCGQIINILSTRGFIVGGAKLTGTSRMKDILHMKKQGARYVLDFMDVGYPSTYQCSQEELEYIFRVFKQYFITQGCDFLVLEVADGIFQRETEMILTSPIIMREVLLFTLSAGNSLCAYGGIEYLKQKFGIIPDFISGLITTDWLSMKELSSKFSVSFLEPAHESKESFLRLIFKKTDSGNYHFQGNKFKDLT